MTESYDLIVIGAGPGGYVTAIRAAQLKMKTLLIEKESTWGGTCLNVGCIPSKTLLHYSDQFASYQQKDKGISCLDSRLDLLQLMQTKKGVIQGLNQGIQSLLKKNKVQYKVGTASFKEAHQIEVLSDQKKELFEAKHNYYCNGLYSKGSSGSSL